MDDAQMMPIEATTVTIDEGQQPIPNAAQHIGIQSASNPGRIANWMAASSLAAIDSPKEIER